MSLQNVQYKPSRKGLKKLSGDTEARLVRPGSLLSFATNN